MSSAPIRPRHRALRPARAGGPRRRPGPVLAAVLGLAGAALVGAVVQGGGAAGERPDPSAAGAPRSGPALASASARALTVLHRWDERRRHAWSAQDPGALRRLYTVGSAAGRADLRLLAGYRASGWRVTGLRMQLLSIRVRGERDTALVLEVRERFAGGTVRSTGGRAARLVAGAPARRLLRMRRVEGRWRMASVRDLGRLSAPRWSLR